MSATAPRNGAHRFHADPAPTPTLGYAPAGATGSDVYGGPTIEARRGVPANVTVKNPLGTHPLASSMDHTFMGMTDTDETAPRRDPPARRTQRAVTGRVADGHDHARQHDVVPLHQFYSDSTGTKPRTTEIEQPKLNTVEEWDIVDTTGDAHPIHLHLTQFRILNRQRFDEPAWSTRTTT